MTRTGFTTRASRPVNLAIVSLIYFVVCLLSTTGVDVLMLLTGVLMIWATVREFAGGVLEITLASVVSIVAPAK